MSEHVHRAKGENMTTGATAVPPLSGKWLTAARAGWLILAFLAVLILITSLPGYTLKMKGQFDHVSYETVAGSVVFWATLAVLASLASALLSLGLAAMLFRRRFAEPVAEMLSFYLLIYAVVMAGPLEVWAAYWTGSMTLAVTLQTVLLSLPTVALFFLFPNGRFVPTWTRWLVLLAIPWSISLLFVATDAVSLTALTPLELGLLFLWYASFLMVALYAQVYRYRHVSSPVERQQTKWVMFGFSLWFVYILLSTVPYLYLTNLPPGTPIPWWAQISTFGWFLALNIIPVSLTIAVTRYHLWDIDLVINRTLVYGVLTAVVVGLYALVVGAAGILFQKGSNLTGVLLTAVLIIIFFRPLRSLLQQGADRLVRVGGKRPSPEPPSPAIITAPKVAAEPSPAHMTGGWLRLAQAIWLLLALTVTGLYLWAATDLWQPIDILFVPWNFFMPLGFFIIATIIALRKPDDGMALLTSLMLIFVGPYLISGTNETIGAQRGWEMVNRVLVGIGFSSFILFQALFPNGCFVPGWIRPWAFLTIAINFASLLLLPEVYTDFWVSLLLVSMAVGILAQIYRYRQVSTSVQRQQTKWVVVGLSGPVLVVIYWFLIVTPGIYPIPTESFPYFVHQIIFASLALLLPLTLAFSILRYRLWDIDVIINRALVYTALTACIIAVYALVVGAMGALFQTQGNWIIALIATGLVAVLFQPLRERWQRWINQLLYGRRDEPFEVLASLGQRLEDTMSPETVYPTIVETVAQTLKLPYAALAVRKEDGFATAVSYGKPTTTPTIYPLTYQGELIGQLVVGHRAADEDFSEADERLLRNIARQAGTAVHAVQLTADLQQSRQEIVTSREEERRRLRRDLHDGLGPTLASHMLKIGSARALLAENPALADQLLSEMENDVEKTLAEVRRIVYDLRPPELDQLGLVKAIQAYVDEYERVTGLTITLHTPSTMPPLPAAAEVAAYRIAQEGLANVIRHAQARHCIIGLMLETAAAGNGDGRLRLTIQDDGVGLSEHLTVGVGLHSMRERAEELGGTISVEPLETGGTLINALLPLPGG